MRGRSWLLWGLLLSPAPAALLALQFGAYPISPLEVWRVLAGLWSGGDQTETVSIILWQVRLPRIVLAMLVGLALSTSGATLQAVFRNPLVDAFILGISSGAAFGCAVSVAFFPALPIQLGAFTFSLISAFLTFALARTRGEVPILSLILAGVIVSAFFSALVSMIKFLVDPQKLASIVFWLMGSLSLADWLAVRQAGPFIALGSLLIWLGRWRLNALSMGDAEAKSLGLAVNRERGLFLLAAALTVAAAVSVSGIIGWVGLIIPHVVRMSVGPDHRRVVPLSMALGASFLVLSDTVARTSTSGEIPVGIITTLAGAPFFIYLLKQRGQGSWQA
ncbi:FecCD family ABC transporter permease [Desulfobacca acetoxidans]|uniref:ABC-type transporter, integral membrane subunit n=1 Tax=Desulfobacca acetoxidans (strain ATCC 700848 / DSM 11109 / ASRB2) TaxID=880072 RepID=F2NIC6_DESAR|nr:iron ABC transporter permease [Desulfobacca acetoxidans]AEB10328.1 ABC-type transporter, integral membrane subunit [Desulfobacca acetoxidans DSM 11109]HAY23140.1 iron ABC transporter permease [Desulfobacterales bacterium]